jgi:hypothetical protein
VKNIINPHPDPFGLHAFVRLGEPGEVMLGASGVTGSQFQNDTLQ